MTAVLPSAIADDLVDRLRTAFPDMGNRITYGPPESAPLALSIWVDYGPVEWDWGLMGVQSPQLAITVALPRKAQYPLEYRLVTDQTHQVVQALRGQLLLADEAPITGVSVGRAGGMNFAGVSDALMAAVVTLAIETKQE